MSAFDHNLRNMELIQTLMETLELEDCDELPDVVAALKYDYSFLEKQDAALRDELSNNTTQIHHYEVAVENLEAELARKGRVIVVYEEFQNDISETLELHESHWSYHLHKELSELEAALKERSSHAH